MNWRVNCFVTAALVVFGSGVIGPPLARAAGGCVPGSYLVLEGSGTRSLWKFSRGGTFQVTSSAERALNFSHLHGAWKQKGSRGGKATGLDFVFLTDPVSGGVPPEFIARIDAQFSFSRNCKEIEGAFEIRFFAPDTDDPLDPATGTFIGHDTFTGRRITVP